MTDAPSSPPAVAAVPLRKVGPVLLAGPEVSGEFLLPLATFESPLWPSVARGARVAKASGGLRAVVLDDRMSRSVVVEAADAVAAQQALCFVREHQPELERETRATSRYARLLDMDWQVVGKLLYLRFAFSTGDAAGHNMVTAAADRLLGWILGQRPELSYVSISGNYCTDKKCSAVNGILGRGKYVVADLTVPARVCARLLKATPEEIAALHLKKNLVGTALAGGIRSANAHFANMLLAFYLATGQDAANIVEGSQGFVHADASSGDLYFSVTLPNVIVGAVGNGKDLAFARRSLEDLGCRGQGEPGSDGRRLAILAAAAVWCGELSLLAAQARPGELMKAHLRLERAARGTT